MTIVYNNDQIFKNLDSFLKPCISIIVIIEIDLYQEREWERAIFLFVRPLCPH